MAWSREEIIASMMETIAECEDAIQARPTSKREKELTLVSSGFHVVQVNTDEEALALATA